MSKKADSPYLPIMIRMYEKGISMPRIAREFGRSYNWVRKTLKGKVQFRSRQFRSRVCVDCETKLEVGKRCRLHRRVRLAELKRNWAREKYGLNQRPLMKDYGYE